MGEAEGVRDIRIKLHFLYRFQVFHQRKKYVATGEVEADGKKGVWDS